MSLALISNCSIGIWMIQDIYPLIFVFFGGYMTTCTLTQYPRVDSLKNRQILVGKCCIYEYQKFYYFYIGCDGIEISAKLKNEIFYLICGHNNSTFSTFFFFFLIITFSTFISIVIYHMNEIVPKMRSNHQKKKMCSSQFLYLTFEKKNTIIEKKYKYNNF